jgi:hypothetical protein
MFLTIRDKVETKSGTGGEVESKSSQSRDEVLPTGEFYVNRGILIARGHRQKVFAWGKP